MFRFVSIALFAVSIVCMGATNASSARYDKLAGKATYDATCAMCHKAGMMGAPKVGDKAAWAARIKQGMDVMVTRAINGLRGKKGMMPKKGGNPKLTDAQVGNAVAYMVSRSK